MYQENYYEKVEKRYTRLDHLDGLRGIAVSLVLLFHLDEKLFFGGYLGVDTFFVISGYVITKTLIENQGFSLIKNLKNFFFKRLYRITPALFVFLILSFSIYIFFGQTFNHHRTLFTAISSLIGISNLYLNYIGVDYFLIEKINYYLHTWSLGVEEQFYIFYPFIILIFFKTRITLVYLLFLISFILFIYFWDKNIGGFYSPTVRFWEILIGCILYLKLRNNFYQISLSIKVLLISIYFLNIFYLGNLLSTQIQILMNVILTVFFILFFNKSVFLCNKLFKHLGLISFSIYLWHFFIINIIEPFIINSIIKIIIIIFLTYLISYSSYLYVEKYFLFRGYILKRHYIFVFSSIIIFTTFIFANINFKNIDYSNFNDLKLSIVNSIWSKQDKILDNNYFNKKIKSLNLDIIKADIPIDLCKSNKGFKCLKIDQKNKTGIFLVGDSHANHLVNGLLLSKDVGNLFLGDECMHILLIRHLLYGELRDNAFERIKYCEKYDLKNDFLDVNKISKKFDKFFYIISIRIPLYAEKWEIVDENFNQINKKDDKYNQIYTNFKSHLANVNENIKIIFVEPIPTFDYGPEYCLISEKRCSVDMDDIEFDNKDTLEIFDKLLRMRQNSKVIDFKKYLCKTNTCFMKDVDNKFLYFDDNHLSKHGSETLAEFYNDLININD